ncbi:hypothetical protein [Serratia ureilytica]|uniref:hypothetical protein n=1 Tax=Serratia ureilytica TaxID=300181 RepID=UPI00313D06BF
MSNLKEDGLIESVKKTLMDRINTPLFGFIFISWVIFNWDNILFVMFSELTIEQRIKAIKLSPDLYSKGLLCPVSSGFLFSVAFPYLQWGVSFLQRKAQKLLDKNSEKRELAEYATIKALAKERAEANNAVAIEEAAAALAAAEKSKQAAQVESEAKKIREDYRITQSEVVKATNALSGILTNIENQKERESALKVKVSDLEGKIIEAQRELEDLGEVHEMKKQALSCLGEMNIIVDGLKMDILDIKTEAIGKGISGGSISENVSFDGLSFLEFTKRVSMRISSLDDSITDVIALLEDDIPF